MYDISRKIRPPLYLIGKTILCWRCEAKMPAVALLAPHVADTEGNTCVLTQKLWDKNTMPIRAQSAVFYLETFSCILNRALRFFQ
jgi:hypothetical protein